MKLFCSMAIFKMDYILMTLRGTYLGRNYSKLVDKNIIIFKNDIKKPTWLKNSSCFAVNKTTLYRMHYWEDLSKKSGNI